MPLGLNLHTHGYSWLMHHEDTPPPGQATFRQFRPLLSHICVLDLILNNMFSSTATEAERDDEIHAEAATLNLIGENLISEVLQRGD